MREQRQRPFSTNPDRVAAVQEKMARDARHAREAAAERLSEACARELTACVELGLGWPEIRQRLAQIA